MSTQVVQPFPVLPPVFNEFAPIPQVGKNMRCSTCNDPLVHAYYGKDTFWSCPNANAQNYDWTQPDADIRMCTTTWRNISPVFVKHNGWKKYSRS